MALFTDSASLSIKSFFLISSSPGCLSISVEALVVIPHTSMPSPSEALSLTVSLISSKTETAWVETARLSPSFSLFISTLHLVLRLFVSLPVSSLLTS